MKRIVGVVASAFAGLAMQGCDGGADGERDATRDDPPAADGVLLDTVRQPLERARRVEDLGLERKRELDAELERTE